MYLDSRFSCKHILLIVIDKVLVLSKIIFNSKNVLGHQVPEKNTDLVFSSVLAFSYWREVATMDEVILIIVQSL